MKYYITALILLVIMFVWNGYVFATREKLSFDGTPAYECYSSYNTILLPTTYLFETFICHREVDGETEFKYLVDYASLSDNDSPLF